MTVTPRIEQETIISFDKELNQWHYYSDVPEQNRKWDSLIDAERKEVEPNGTISVLEGTITGSVNINKRPPKRKISDEQRRAMAERARANFSQ